ncbi:MAG: hypothetical protein K6E75_09265 [Lachnospiraceae bacterium]|nr:hypothetical protein [Lachnospiraceae bacterium]
MKEKCIAVILMICMCVTGCGLGTLKKDSEEKETSFSNIYELDDEQVYVWKDKGYGDITKDLAKDKAGRDAFFKAPLGTISFAGKEEENDTQIPRIVWFEEDGDKHIPTVTDKDAILFLSKDTVPEEIVFERFADNGYSIGVAGMQADKGGHFYIPYTELGEDTYRYHIDPQSDAAALMAFEGIDRLFLDKVGEERVTEDNVSDGGVVEGLNKRKAYGCQFYTGTYYQDYQLSANVRTFTSMERFVSFDYEFLHANCIRLQIPEYFKSGYYLVLGKGLIRYVSSEDEGVYNGQATDDAIDWNDPIILYDESGICIYDPSSGIGMDEEMTEDSDEGVEDEEITDEVITDKKIAGGKTTAYQGIMEAGENSGRKNWKIFGKPLSFTPSNPIYVLKDKEIWK